MWSRRRHVVYIFVLFARFHVVACCHHRTIGQFHVQWHTRTYKTLCQIWCKQCVDIRLLQREYREVVVLTDDSLVKSLSDTAL